MVWRKFLWESWSAIPARSLGWAAQRPPAILIQTTVLRPVSQPRLLATKIGGEWAFRSEQASLRWAAQRPR